MDIVLDKQKYNELLIGCGKNRNKKLYPDDRRHWENLYTLDINAAHAPDITWDLNDVPLPFADGTFNEIHAYEVLEHTGKQGEYKFFFAQFSDFWRILKPNGFIFGTSPLHSSKWAWGDPSHTRIIQEENFVFLNQAEYKAQVGQTTMSDFRYIYQADYVTYFVSHHENTLLFALRAVKPSRIEK